MEPIVPSVSLNGTGKKLLLEQYLEAMNKIEDAIAALGATNPHGRDFVGRNDDFITARNEHSRRVRALQAVRHELEEIATAVNDA
jgi:hypothetical protein